MSAYYKIQENPPKEGGSSSSHARFIPKDTIRIDRLCKEISHMSTFTPGEVKGIMQALSDRIIFHLRYGEDLDIEGLGHFTVSLNCDEPQNGGRHTAVHVHFKTVKFRCSKKIKQELKTMDFEPVPKGNRYSSLSPKKRQQNILNYLAHKEVIQSSVCMALNNCSRYMALRDLKVLMEKKKIVQIGHKKSAMYKLTS